MFEKLDYNFAKQQVPYFHFIEKNFEGESSGFSLGRKWIETIPTPSGYCFLLRSLRYDSFLMVAPEDAPPALITNNFGIEFIVPSRGRALQNESIPLNQLCTPGYRNLVSGPGAFTYYPPVKNNMILNYIYQTNEPVQFKILNNTSEEPQVEDHIWFLIVLIGYFIPDKKLPLWR